MQNRWLSRYLEVVADAQERRLRRPGCFEPGTSAPGEVVRSILASRVESPWSSFFNWAVAEGIRAMQPGMWSADLA
jgi:hypothetical protein